MARRFAATINDLVHDQQIIFEGVFDTVASMGIPNLSREDRPSSDVVFEQGVERVASVEKTSPVGNVIVGEQHLADGHSVGCERVLPVLQYILLAYGGDGLQREQRGHCAGLSRAPDAGGSAERGRTRRRQARHPPLRRAAIRAGSSRTGLESHSA